MRKRVQDSGEVPKPKADGSEMTETPKSNLYGLFVGVDKYESEEIRPLAFASKDVLSVRDKLAKVCGLSLDNTVVLADDPETGSPATRRALLRAMHRFASAPMGGEDLFLFVFAGHGFSSGGRTFLATHDSEIASDALLRETAVSLETVRDFLAQIPASQQVLILDACRDAPVKGTRSVIAEGMAEGMARDIGAVVQAGSTAARENRRATAVLCSCWEGQIAHEYPEAAHGWFCYNLLEELENVVKAELPLSELHRRINRRMQQSAWRLLPAATDQAPHLLIDGDIPALPVSASAVTNHGTRPSDDAGLVTTSAQYCAVCGSSLTADRFRCTRCGQVCCVTCRDSRWGFCSKCSGMIRSRAKKSGRKPASPSSQKQHRRGVELAFVSVPPGEFRAGRKQTVGSTQAFEISRRAVACGEYALFLKETGYKPEGGVATLLSSRSESQPVGSVTYQDALAFAEWAGCTLPDERQWEKAARGTDGRSYPWGDSYDATCCNSADSGRAEPLPVDSLPEGQSPFGCLQMSGNVWEWTASWYDPGKTERVVRGGSYREGKRACRCYYREGIDPRYSKPDLGFRCARSQ